MTKIGHLKLEFQKNNIQNKLFNTSKVHVNNMYIDKIYICKIFVII